MQTLNIIIGMSASHVEVIFWCNCILPCIRKRTDLQIQFDNNFQTQFCVEPASSTLADRTILSHGDLTKGDFKVELHIKSFGIFLNVRLD